MPPVTIPQFLVPRGAPSARTLQRTLTLSRRQQQQQHHHHLRIGRTFTTTPSSLSQEDKSKRVLDKPDKFRPPSHPARRVLQPRNGKANSGPVNYPGPRLSEQEVEEKKTKQYPNMFPPEGTVMFKFLTSRWIHVWIAMGILTTLATFTFSENFKHTSPFAHLLPPWSTLFWHPFSTISQALSVYRMDVQHNSMLTREKRRKRVDDAEKRRKYRVAHGLEEDTVPETETEKDAVVVDDQSPVAPDVNSNGQGEGQVYVDWEGNKKPVKKWLGVW